MFALCGARGAREELSVSVRDGHCRTGQLSPPLSSPAVWPLHLFGPSLSSRLLGDCVEVGAIEAQIKDAKLRRKRSSTAVVGDMSEMLDSLPTFDLLLDRATIQSRLHQRWILSVLLSSRKGLALEDQFSSPCPWSTSHCPSSPCPCPWVSSPWQQHWVFYDFRVIWHQIGQYKNISTTYSLANFSKFCRPVCQIPLTAANFPHMALNFLRPHRPDQICSICRW